MTTPDAPALVPPAQPSKPFDEAEFLRRTFDRSLAEMDRTRNYFEVLLRRTLWAVGLITALIIAAGGWLGFRSWTDVQDRMEGKLRDTQTAIAERGEQTIRETNGAIQARAEAAFKDESIKEYVREVAKQKTMKARAARFIGGPPLAEVEFTQGSGLNIRCDDSRYRERSQGQGS